MRIHKRLLSAFTLRLHAHAVLRSGLKGKIHHLESRIRFLEKMLLRPESDLGRTVQSRLKQLWTYLKPHTVLNHTKKRFGSMGDGGYVLLDDFKPTDVVISLRVGPDNSTDVSLAEVGCVVHAFDHTVEKLPGEHQNIFFHKKGLGSDSSDLLPLQEIMSISDPDDNRDLVLLCDIEGAEWTGLTTEIALKCLSRFKQISLELHGLQNLYADQSWSVMDILLSNLNRSHAVIHLHVNNAEPVFIIDGKSLPTLLEVTWVRRTDYEISTSVEKYPNDLDYPNVPFYPEQELNI